MAIVPDTKDWTWVLQRPCPECGVVAADIDPETVPLLVREGLPRWVERLSRADARTRPDDSTWSPTEYACHVRDVCVKFAERTALIRDEDDPQFANWDQDETALAERYDLQDPAVVAEELAAAGEAYAATLETVTDWERPGRRSNGSSFTQRTLAQYFVHDYVHHLWDVDA